MNQVPGGQHHYLYLLCDLTQDDILVYDVTSDGTEEYWTRVVPDHPRYAFEKKNKIWLIKDLDGKISRCIAPRRKQDVC